MAGHARMRELMSDVSGHHLLLRHWVTESALMIDKRVDARALAPVATWVGAAGDEDEAGEELAPRWRGGKVGGASESLSEGEGEGRGWKGR